jgi:hypothetical protein
MEHIYEQAIIRCNVPYPHKYPDHMATAIPLLISKRGGAAPTFHGLFGCIGCLCFGLLEVVVVVVMIK